MKNAHKDYTGHDVAHVERVYALALHIAHNEGNTNTLIIELATLLHDTVDNKITDEKLAYSKLVSFLKSIELTDEEIKHILHIIQHMSYRGGKNNNIEMSIDGKIVKRCRSSRRIRCHWYCTNISICRTFWRAYVD